MSPRRTSRTGPEDRAHTLLADAVACAQDPSRRARLLAALAALGPASLAAADAALAGVIDPCHRRGWTPADLTHVVGRELSAAALRVVAAAILVSGGAAAPGPAGAGAAGPAGANAMHPRWRSQLDDLAPLAAEAAGLDLETRLDAAIAALAFLPRLPVIAVTLPPPGTVRVAAGGQVDPTLGRHLDERTLTRVRALLAKAESTTFEAEAEALAAKAQELITRHAIDQAVLAEPDRVGDPVSRRIHLDDPYADARATLVSAVAAANRCRSVYSPGLGWVTVIGYEADLDAVELLTASLLTQAVAGLARHGPVRDGRGRSRTRSFRRAFLFGFAARIGQRLQAVSDAEVAATSDGDRARLLPVLAAREDRLQAVQAELFGQLAPARSATLSNAQGWHAGRAAADRAELGFGAPRLPRR